MLPRVLEPEAMDTAEEARDYDAMDHAAVNARFVADFLAAHGPCRGGEILDVGTGPGRIAIALCRADPAARVLALDLAEAMLDLARRNVAAAGLTVRIACVQGDAKGLPWPDGRFEAVISNTIVHHIPDPAPRPGGDGPRWWRRGARCSSATWPGPPRARRSPPWSPPTPAATRPPGEPCSRPRCTRR